MLKFTTSRIANYEQGTRRIGVEEARSFASVFQGFHEAYFLGTVDERENAVLLALRKAG